MASKRHILAELPGSPLLVLCACLTRPAIAGAEPLAPVQPSASPRAPLDAATRDEARRRFDRGLSLYNAADLSGALAEFQLAYRLTGHPLVLYNLALVQARLGHSVAALDAFSKLATDGRSELTPEQAERAQRALAEQQLRVGNLQINVDPVGVSVQIDNVDVARTPTPPLRVDAGTHLVSLSAAGYEPRHLSVSVAGGALEVVTVQLVPLQSALAHLRVTSNVPGAAVLANGEPVGRTPLTSDLAVRPDSYAIALTRDGYLPESRQIHLHGGSMGQLDVHMAPSQAGLAHGGTLSLTLSEPNAIVTIDGEARLDQARSVRLPLGPHTLRVERKGFLALEREVRISAGENRIDVTLLPTPTHLVDYVSRTRTQRTWSYVAFGAGLLVTGSSAGFLIWNQGQKQEAQRAFEQYQASVEGGMCPTNACAETLGILVDDLDSKRQRDVYGWVGVGLGAALLGAGSLLYALGGDPKRYDPKPQSDVFGPLALKLGPRRVGLSVTF
jgi:hypothetical protein